MKIATLKNGTPDGHLVVVSRDLSVWTSAKEISPTLQNAIDNWNEIEPELRDLSDQLNSQAVTCSPFKEEDCLSPLPRAYQWADGSAYINHVELVRKARGAEVPDSFYSDPLMYQGGSDKFLAPRDSIPLGASEWGCDMEGEIAVITDEVSLGTSVSDAADHIKLIMLVNDVSLRALIPAELAKGFGFLQSKPASAFSPVAVTPDELGAAWKDNLVHLPLCIDYRGEPFGRANAGIDATFNFAELVAHLAKTRIVGAGSIIGSGTVSNKDEAGGPGKPVDEGGRGYSCIAEIRMIETIKDGTPSTPFMSSGDVVRIEMLDENGDSIFGAIEQTVQNASE